jgi:hypothetical protein
MLWKENHEDNYYIMTEDGLQPEEEAIESCFEAESNDRDFSPFEFTASEINHSTDPETYWEAYEKGISEAILTTAENLEIREPEEN